MGVSDLIEVGALVAPDARGEEAEWFARCAERRLTFQRCEACAAVVFPPRGACPTCGGVRLSVQDSAGLGAVYSYTIQRRATRPDMADDTVFALIDLDEGFRMLSVVVEPAEAARVGQRVELRFAACAPRAGAASDRAALVPVFVPAG
jgi:uncharacterized OB-fold protein